MICLAAQSDRFFQFIALPDCKIVVVWNYIRGLESLQLLIALLLMMHKKSWQACIEDFLFAPSLTYTHTAIDSHLLYTCIPKFILYLLIYYSKFKTIIVAHIQWSLFLTNLNTVVMVVPPDWTLSGNKILLLFSIVTSCGCL